MATQTESRRRVIQSSPQTPIQTSLDTCLPAPGGKETQINCDIKMAESCKHCTANAVEDGCHLR